MSSAREIYRVMGGGGGGLDNVFVLPLPLCLWNLISATGSISNSSLSSSSDATCEVCTYFWHRCERERERESEGGGDSELS